MKAFPHIFVVTAAGGLKVVVCMECIGNKSMLKTLLSNKKIDIIYIYIYIYILYYIYIHTYIHIYIYTRQLIKYQIRYYAVTITWQIIATNITTTTATPTNNTTNCYCYY